MVVVSGSPAAPMAGCLASGMTVKCPHNTVSALVAAQAARGSAAPSPSSAAAALGKREMGRGIAGGSVQRRCQRQALVS